MFGVVALRRLPPLKTSVVVCSWFGVVVWLSGLECLVRVGVREIVEFGLYG